MGSRSRRDELGLWTYRMDFVAMDLVIEGKKAERAASEELK